MTDAKHTPFSVTIARSRILSPIYSALRPSQHEGTCLYLLSSCHSRHANSKISRLDPHDSAICIRNSFACQTPPVYIASYVYQHNINNITQRRPAFTFGAGLDRPTRKHQYLLPPLGILDINAPGKYRCVLNFLVLLPY